MDSKGNIYVGVDTVPTARKPDRGEGYIYGEIRKRATAQWGTVPVDGFADLVGNHGHAFIPGHLENGFKAGCCTEQQVFAIDFDNGFTVEEFRKRCEELGLYISIIYHTLSHTHDNERFRAIFITDDIILKAISDGKNVF